MALLFLQGCSKLQPGADPVVFSLDTKAIVSAGDNKTFRVMLFNEQDRSFVQSGTYYKAAGETALVACELNAGAFVKEDASKGINGFSGNANVVLVSPGIMNNNDGSLDYNPDQGGLYVNAPKIYAIGRYGAITLTDPLYEPKSTISFEFYQKTGVSGFSIADDKVMIVGVNAQDETVRIYPALRQVVMASNSQEREIPLARNEPPSADPALNNYLKCYNTADANKLQIASGIYAPKDVAHKYLNILSGVNVKDGDYIYMSCTMTQGTRTFNLRLPLNAENVEMLPQYHYVYKVLVESDYISVVLDVYDNSSNHWQGGGDSSSNVGTLSNSIKIGEWSDNGWTPAGNIGFEIG